MAKQEQSPPNCPECGEALTTVRWEVDSDLYRWSVNKYSLSSEGGGTTRCPHCDADVSDLFPDGPVNY
jgi:ribosomal protein L34E